MIKRYISLLVRQNKRKKVYKKFVTFVEMAMNEIKLIPIKPPVKDKVLMLIRLDEIGDYILSRNFLPTFRNTDKYKDHRIVFVGNQTCKNLAETLDNEYIDQFIWIDKDLFKNESYYRSEIFQKIRNIGPSTVIELERTSDVNLGDLIVFASHAPERYGSANHYENQLLNQLSNSFYSDIYANGWTLDHEFEFNKKYVNWLCHTDISINKPFIDLLKLPSRPLDEKYILCVIGSSKKSKNWPVTSWMILLKKLITVFDGKIVLLGGEREKENAEKILSINISPNIVSMVDQTSLTEALAWAAHATLMIANDTFAIHAGVAFGTTPTLAMSNGESAFRFSELQHYANNYSVIYASPYIKRLPLMNPEDRWFYNVPSVDMATIRPADVFKKAIEMLAIGEVVSLARKSTVLA